MKTLLILFALSALAEESKRIAEVEALKLENYSLRLDLLQKEAESIHRERNEVIRKICAAAEVPLQECEIDFAKREVKRRKP